MIVSATSKARISASVCNADKKGSRTRAWSKRSTSNFGWRLAVAGLDEAHDRLGISAGVLVDARRGRDASSIVLIESAFGWM
jgi:hypothetical protein